MHGICIYIYMSLTYTCKYSIHTHMLWFILCVLSCICILLCIYICTKASAHANRTGSYIRQLKAIITPTAEFRLVRPNHTQSMHDSRHKSQPTGCATTLTTQRRTAQLQPSDQARVQADNKGPVYCVYATRQPKYSAHESLPECRHPDKQARYICEQPLLAQT